MKIEDDGHLCLHQVDMIRSNFDPTNPQSYGYTARVTAAYAVAAGYAVTYAAPGLLHRFDAAALRQFRQHEERRDALASGTPG